MTGIAADSAPPKGAAVAKKPDDKPTEGRAVNFRAPKRLADRLDRVAEALGLDVSNLVRMILSENLPQYEARADEILKRSADRE